jgi:protein transport protein YIF1
VRKPKRVSDVNAMGATSPSAPFNPAPTAATLTPNMQQQQFANMQSPNYYTPETSPAGFAQSPGNFNQYPQQPQQFGQNGPQQRMNPQEQQGGFGQQFAMFQQPMVQDMAFQYGQKLADQGKEIVNKEFEKYIPVTKLKYYFAVDNKYVMNKLRLLFFPFAHKDWSLKYDQENPVQPRYDINAPDLYIPAMAYITYVVLAGFILGTQERFSPEQLGIQASSALAYNIFELIVYTITLYVSNISTSLRTLDLVAFSGYKYAIVVAILCASIMFGSTGYYIGLIYCGSSLAFFLVSFLRSRIIFGFSFVLFQHSVISLEFSIILL